MKYIVRWLVLIVMVVGPLKAADAVPRLVRPGDVGITGGSLAPFDARYQDVSTVEGASTPGGVRLVRLERLPLRGSESLRLGITMLGPTDSVRDEIQVMGDTLAPVMRFVSSLSLLHQVEVFDGASMQGFQLAKDGSTAEKITIQPDGARFAGATLDLILASMPLAEGMRVDLPMFSTDMGPAMANLLTRAHVGAKTTVAAAGREWPVWVVEVERLTATGEALRLPTGEPMPRARLWLSHEPPYTIRAQWRPGSALELVEIR